MPYHPTVWRRREALAAAAVAAAAAAPQPVAAAPKAELWPRWQAHDPSSTATIDHSRWAEILADCLDQHGDGVNRLHYARLGAEWGPALAAYVDGLQAVDPDGLGRPEQMAFWINLYNATTVNLIIEHFPVGSIREINISPGLFSFGPWGKKLVRVAGEPLSLDDIEHRIIRPIMQDPRIHYAVNCAAVGCPNLQPVPFTGSELEAMLEAGAHGYVNDPRGVTLLSRRWGADRLSASRIYDWFVEDFGGDEAGVLAHLRSYASDETVTLLAGVERIDTYHYDWSLNVSGG